MTENAALQSRVQEVSELQQQQLQSSEREKQTIRQQLTAELTRAEETIRREQQQRQEMKASLNGEVATARQRYNVLEDCFDKKISEKNKELQRLKLIYEEKAQELAAIMTERDELVRISLCMCLFVCV